MVDRGTTSPGRSNVVSTSDVEALAANLRQTESQREKTDFAEQLISNWKNVIMMVALVAVSALGVQWMREGRENARGGVSQKFEAMQGHFAREFFDAPDGTDHQRAFDDVLKAIGDVDSRSSYAQLSEIYKGAAELQRGEVAVARERFQPFNIGMLQKSGKLTKEELFTELALLVKAKVLCADDSTKNDGQSLLRSLALDAKVVPGEALLSYSRIFGLDQGLVDTTLQAHPALRESIKSELIALGAKV